VPPALRRLAPDLLHGHPMRRIGVAVAIGVVLGSMGALGVAYAAAGVAMGLGTALVGPRRWPDPIPVGASRRSR
jgi:hypothetical protein